jgi:hypothetical protein
MRMREAIVVATITRRLAVQDPHELYLRNLEDDVRPLLRADGRRARALSSGGRGRTMYD